MIKQKASEYIKNGLSVHLLKPAEKRPINNGWSTAIHLTQEQADIEFNRTPDANIGVRLGDFTKIGSRYLYVLDLDISSLEQKDIQDAYTLLSKVYANYTQLPCVRSATTNSRHFYFLSKVLLKTKKLGHSDTKVTVKINGEDKVKNSWEIDLCSTGKQVVLPPSVFNGKTYQWERDLLEYLNDDSKKQLMIIDNISLLTTSFEEKEEVELVGEHVKSQYSIDEVGSLLKKLPEDFYDNYDDWLKVGMALHHHFYDTDDEQEAISLYDEFSKQSSKYEKGASFKKWRSFTKQADGITLGTIFYHIPKVTLDRFTVFSNFLNSEKVTPESLKEVLKEINLKDYELEPFIALISEALTKSLGIKYTATATRKVLKGLEREIDHDEQEKLDKLAMGLDDTLTTIVLKNRFNDGKHLLNLNGNVFQYKNGFWSPMEKAMLERAIMEEIKVVFSSKNQEYKAINDVILKRKKNDDLDGLTNKIFSLILKNVATSEQDDILNLRGGHDKPYSVVNTLNKELYIQNGIITAEDHKYDSYLNSRLEIHYNPDESSDCPTWDYVIKNAFRDYHDVEEVTRHLYELLGTIIQSVKREPFFLLFLGKGSNGKSLIMKMFSKMMGMNSVLSDEMSGFGDNPHDNVKLLGKKMFLDDDFAKGAFLPDGFIKKISENKQMTANPKFKNEFQFISNATPVIISNDSVKSKDVSHGIDRRAQVFYFNNIIEKQDRDPHLEQKMQLEFSGFFNKIMKAFCEFQKRGYKYDEPLSIKKNNLKWLKGSNPFKYWFEETLITTKDYSDRIKGQVLFDKYVEFTKEENHSMSLSRNNFYSELEKIEGVSQHTNPSDQTTYFHGIKNKKF